LYFLATCIHNTGEKIWEREIDCYGKVRRLNGDKDFCPYLYQGQSVDEETGLAYNRFRYYDNESGNYLSQDPIGLLGGNIFYGYSLNPNLYTDVYGLSSTDLANDMARGTNGVKPANTQAHHAIPEAVWNKNSDFMNDIGLGGQRDKAFNGIALPGNEGAMKGSGISIYHQGSHKNYNAVVEARVSSIRSAYEAGVIDEKIARADIRKLQMEMKNKLTIGLVSTGHTQKRHSKRLH
jgi:RHS repeat-associated protein